MVTNLSTVAVVPTTPQVPLKHFTQHLCSALNSIGLPPLCCQYYWHRYSVLFIQRPLWDWPVPYFKKSWDKLHWRGTHFPRISHSLLSRSSVLVSIDYKHGSAIKRTSIALFSIKLTPHSLNGLLAALDRWQHSSSLASTISTSFCNRLTAFYWWAMQTPDQTQHQWDKWVVPSLCILSCSLSSPPDPKASGEDIS